MGLKHLILIFSLFQLSQQSFASQWITDGSPQLRVSNNEVICSNAPQIDDRYNALWEEGGSGVTSGQHYWRIQFSNLNQNSLFLGVTDKARFKKGYATRGLFYGGNLANGVELLVGNFGPRIKSNDIVGIFVMFAQDKIKLYFDVNGESVGLAYELPSSLFPKGIYPVVQFNGDGIAKISKISRQGPSLIRKPKSGLDDEWILRAQEFKINGIAKKLPDTVRQVTMSIEKMESGPLIGQRYAVGFKVMNSMSFIMEFKDGKWTTGVTMSTKMYGGLEVAAFEGYMEQLKNSPTKIEVDSKSHLLSWENRNYQISSKWERSPGKNPVTKNPFK